MTAKRRIHRIVLAITGAAVALAAGAAAFVYSGIYDISATDQHTPPVYWLMEFTMRRSVHVRADESKTPDLTSIDMIERGFRHYQASCVQCHGAPGIAPGSAALGMTPVPAYLTPTAREWSAAKIQWVVKNGIKMTGMPAWKYRMSDDEIWEVVAFVKLGLPALSAADYRALSARLPPAKAGADRTPDISSPGARGEAQAGRKAIDQYACATCHAIPGVTGATRPVGPPLAGIASRSFIAGVLANTPANMVQWLVSPQRVSPGTAMPDLGVREQDARDITAYLATLSAD